MITIRRHSARLGIFLSGVLSFSGVQAEPTTTPPSETVNHMQHDGRHDFDFEVGSWKAHVKVLSNRLSHSTDWEEFSGTAVTRTLPMFEGWNESELQVDSLTSGKHSALLGVRLYNPSTHQWAIYGANIKNGIFDPPMIGGFQNDRGEFYAQDTLEGRPIFVRFIWQIIDSTHAHLEQAFSDDGGKTWETNWIYDGERK